MIVRRAKAAVGSRTDPTSMFCLSAMTCNSVRLGLAYQDDGAWDAPGMFPTSDKRQDCNGMVPPRLTRRHVGPNLGREELQIGGGLRDVLEGRTVDQPLLDRPKGSHLHRHALDHVQGNTASNKEQGSQQPHSPTKFPNHLTCLGPASITQQMPEPTTT